MNVLIPDDRDPQGRSCETAAPGPARPRRLLSLDVLRGLSVAAMHIVNNPGSSQFVYRPLAHSSWNGFSAADQIFPTFLFVVGVSMAFSFSWGNDVAARAHTNNKKIFTRALTLVIAGVLINGFPTYDLNNLRFYGVLQRIGLAYMFSAITVQRLARGNLFLFCAFVLVLYWILLGYGPLSPSNNVVGSVDRALFSPSHLDESIFDPEGLLSTIPAVVTVLIGYLAGDWVRCRPVRTATALRLAGWGLSGIALGCLWNLWLPVNKPLWTGSYVVLSAGIALLGFAILFVLVEVGRWHRCSRLPAVLGTNAFVLYVGSEMISELLAHVPAAARAQHSLYETATLIVPDPKGASLLYAAVVTGVWCGFALLLGRRRVAKA